MDSTQYIIRKFSECPAYQELEQEMDAANWPKFLLHDPVNVAFWTKIYECFDDYQFVMWDVKADRVVALGHCVPVHWDSPLEDLPDSGWDWVLKRAVDQHELAVTPNILSALSISVHPNYQGKGLGTSMVRHMLALGKSKGLCQVIIPLRPSQKSKYPLTSFKDYIEWTTDEGLPFDPWVRVHVRLGAKLLKPCHQSMTIRGSCASWEKWTGLKFPQSGQYIVKGALNPIQIDVERAEGVYIEPNLWMAHET